LIYSARYLLLLRLLLHPRIMSLLDKFQSAAKKVGIQATAFSRDVATMASDGSRQLVTEFKLESECERSAKILSSFLADPAHPESALNAIPKAVLQNAHGLAIFTILKVGFVWSGKAGSGIVIARLEDGSWSAPSCIATGGVGFGLQVGADFSEFVIVLNSEEAVRAFATTGNMTIGGNLSAAVGPIGTGGAVNASLLHPAPLFTYSKNKGLFAGLSLEGTALIERKDTNEAFYGQRIPSLDILRGRVPPPEAASALYDVIESAEQLDESSLPQESYVPGNGVNPNSTNGSATKEASSTPNGNTNLFDAGDAL